MGRQDHETSHPEALHLAKRPTVDVSGDNPEDSAPAADSTTRRVLPHLGVAPPDVLSPDTVPPTHCLGDAPLLAYALGRK